MGKNNQARPRKKAKKRREEARRCREEGSGPAVGETDSEHSLPSVRELITAAVFANRSDVHRRRELVSGLLGRSHRTVAAELAHLLEQEVSQLWNGGWQPADVVRVTSKKLGGSEAALMRCAIAADSAGYEQWGVVTAPSWMSQLEAVDAHRWWDPSRPWPQQLGDFPRVLSSGIDLLDLLGHLPELPKLVTPPAGWSSAPPPEAVPSVHVAPAMLAKVRALLAKAESTLFDAEAEALTAKAQELMTRHRLDRATLEGDAGTDEGVVGRRVGVDDPYSQAKALLLAGIAEANGCRCVWSKDFGFATMFGFTDDLDGVEELFTSLLVQATAALQREGSKQDRYGRSRTRRFRRSFLVAFADRIAQRLRETVDETVATMENESGVALVPILDARARAADDALEATFPTLGTQRMSATDWEGSLAGARLGDQADLTIGTPEHLSAGKAR